MRKKTYEEIKHFIEEENDKECKLETTKDNYIDTHQNLDLRCKCGNPFSTSFHLIKSKNKLHCNECGFKIGYDKERKDGLVVYNYFINKGLIPHFKPEEYINAKIKLPYICINHKDIGIQVISYDNLHQNGGCNYCKIDEGRENRKPQHKKIVENKGYIYVNSIYKNNLLYYRYICPKHIECIQETASSNLAEQGCPLCGREKQGMSRRLDADIVESVFVDRDYTYYEENVYEGNTSRLKYKCNKHPELGWQETNYANVKKAKTCTKCIYENITGENHYLWKGGISPLHNYLRYKINDWKRDSLKEHDYCCGITEVHSNKLVVHHMYSFSSILDETLNELNLDIRNKVNLYSEDELILIEKLLLEKHYKYGLGIPLLPHIHNLYHKVFGRGNNTNEEFQEFKKRYELGEFTEILKEVN